MQRSDVYWHRWRGEEDEVLVGILNVITRTAGERKGWGEKGKWEKENASGIKSEDK